MLLLLAEAFADCRADVATLDAHLERWAEDASIGRFGMAGLPPLVVRPVSDAATGAREGVTVTVGARGFLVDGRPVEADWVVVALQQSPTISWGAQHRDPRFLHVMLAVEPDATWGAVVTAVDAMRRARLDQLLVLFEAPPTVEARLAPPASTIHGPLEGLDALPAEARFGAGVRILDGVLSACPEAREVLGGGGGRHPEERPRYYADTLAPAVSACGCGADPAALAEAFWYLDVRDRVYAVPVVLNARTLVALPPNTPWREAWPQVVAARDGAQLGFPTP